MVFQFFALGAILLGITSAHNQSENSNQYDQHDQNIVPGKFDDICINIQGQ